MIIRVPPASECVAEVDYGFAGEPSELAEISSELLTETHNLTLCMVQFEERLLLGEDGALMAVPAAGPGYAGATESPSFAGRVMAAVKDWVGKVIEKIKLFWAKFVAWLKKLFDAIVFKIFRPREEWLKKNLSALRLLRSFGDAKFTAGSKMIDAGDGPGNMIRETRVACETIVAEAAKLADGQPHISFDEWLERILLSSPIKAAVKSAKVKVLNDLYVGGDSEFGYDVSMIRRLITIADGTFKARAEIEAMGEIGKRAVEAANHLSAETLKNARRLSLNKNSLMHLMLIGPIVAGLIAACTSINSKMNSQVMQALVRALSAGKPGEGWAKKEGASLMADLDAYREELLQVER